MDARVFLRQRAWDYHDTFRLKDAAMIPAQTRNRLSRIEEGASVEERMELAEEQVERLCFRGWDQGLLKDFREMLDRSPMELIRHCLNGHLRTERKSNPLCAHRILVRITPGSEADQTLETIRGLLQNAYRAGVHNHAAKLLRKRLAEALRHA